VPGFKYEYLLYVDGKSYEQFTDTQTKTLKTWESEVNGKTYRIVLGMTLFYIKIITNNKRFFHYIRKTYFKCVFEWITS
jgi:hypothetical protein